MPISPTRTPASAFLPDPCLRFYPIGFPVLVRGSFPRVGETMTSEVDERERHVGLRGFGVLLGLAALLLALATWLEGSDAWRHPLRWLGSLDNASALALLSSSAQVVAGVLAILI